jgi:hypothetical protein
LNFRPEPQGHGSFLPGFRGGRAGLIGSPREVTLVWRMVTIAETDKGSPHGVTAGGV